MPGYKTVKVRLGSFCVASFQLPSSSQATQVNASRCTLSSASYFFGIVIQGFVYLITFTRIVRAHTIFIRLNSTRLSLYRIHLVFISDRGKQVERICSWKCDVG